MNIELKNDLVVTWNEIEEARTSFKELSDAELIECRDSIQERLEKALYWLDKHVDEEDIIKELN